MTEVASTSMLHVANLEVVYHGVVRVLRGVSLDVKSGQIVALLGPNGAGKTTTLRAITGLLAVHQGRATKGRIHLLGNDLLQLAPETIVQRGVAQVMEGRRIFGDLTVEENLSAGAYTRKGTTWRDDLQQIYQHFPILAQRRHQQAGYLSGGEQQMLAISRAWISRPQLLILDEPSLGLAPQIIAQVVEMIRTIRDTGVSILLVEQNAGVALQLADYGYVMENGKIVLDGPTAELQRDQDIQEFYLGSNDGHRRNYRDIKRYRRRRRWLS